MEMTPGFRWQAPPDLDNAGQDDALVARIRDEIEARGPITFARFMTLALYDAEGGYYRSDTPRPGREGDFLTAPEAHPIFGWATRAGGRRCLEHARSAGHLHASGIRQRHRRARPRDPDRPRSRSPRSRHHPSLRAHRDRSPPSDHAPRTFRSRRFRRPARDAVPHRAQRRRSRASSWPTRSSTPCRPTASSCALGTSARSWSAGRAASSSMSKRRPQRPHSRTGSQPRASSSPRASKARSASRSTAGSSEAADRPGTRPAPRHRLRLPGARALRSGPPPRWDAPRLRPPYRPRRPLPPRRPPGPDRPRRCHCRRGGRSIEPVSRTSARRPRPNSSPASAPATFCELRRRPRNDDRGLPRRRGPSLLRMIDPAPWDVSE